MIGPLGGLAILSEPGTARSTLALGRCRKYSDRCRKRRHARAPASFSASYRRPVHLRKRPWCATKLVRFQCAHCHPSRANCSIRRRRERGRRRRWQYLDAWPPIDPRWRMTGWSSAVAPSRSPATSASPWGCRSPRSPTASAARRRPSRLTSTTRLMLTKDLRIAQRCDSSGRLLVMHDVDLQAAPRLSLRRHKAGVPPLPDLSGRRRLVRSREMIDSAAKQASSPPANHDRSWAQARATNYSARPRSGRPLFCEALVREG